MTHLLCKKWVTAKIYCMTIYVFKQEKQSKTCCNIKPLLDGTIIACRFCLLRVVSLNMNASIAWRFSLAITSRRLSRQRATLSCKSISTHCGTKVAYRFHKQTARGSTSKRTFCSNLQFIPSYFYNVRTFIIIITCVLL